MSINGQIILMLHNRKMINLTKKQKELLKKVLPLLEELRLEYNRVAVEWWTRDGADFLWFVEGVIDEKS